MCLMLIGCRFHQSATCTAAMASPVTLVALSLCGIDKKAQYKSNPLLWISWKKCELVHELQQPVRNTMQVVFFICLSATQPLSNLHMKKGWKTQHPVGWHLPHIWKSDLTIYHSLTLLSLSSCDTCFSLALFPLSQSSGQELKHLPHHY